MARTGRKTQEMRHVSFRMPADVHADYVAVAESRGVDLSALLNWVVVEFHPLLLLRRAQHQAAMLNATAFGLPQRSGAGPGPQDALDRVNEVIRQLQDVASKLSQKVGSDGARAAA